MSPDLFTAPMHTKEKAVLQMFDDPMESSKMGHGRLSFNKQLV